MAETKRALKKRYGITINASYLRMLAHKVAQYYRLKTTSPKVTERKDPNLTRVTATFADDCPKGHPHRKDLLPLGEIPVGVKEGADDERDERSSTRRPSNSSVISFGSQRDSISSIGRLHTQSSLGPLSRISHAESKGLPSTNLADNVQHDKEEGIAQEDSQASISAYLPTPPVVAAAPNSPSLPKSRQAQTQPPSPSGPPPLQEQDSLRTLESEYSYGSAHSYHHHHHPQQVLYSYPQVPYYPPQSPSGYIATPTGHGGMQLIGFMPCPPSPSHMMGWQQPQLLYPHPQQGGYPPNQGMYYESHSERTSSMSSGTPRMYAGSVQGQGQGQGQGLGAEGLRHSRLSTSSSARMPDHRPPLGAPASRTLTSLLDNLQLSSSTRQQAEATHAEHQASTDITPSASHDPNGPGGAFLSASAQAQEAISPGSRSLRDLPDFPLPVSLLCCPLSGRIFSDPVLVCTSGHTYDRSSLIEIMVDGKGEDPKTGEVFFSRDLVANHHARAIVEEWQRWSNGDEDRED